MSEQPGTALAELPLTEIAHRIDAYLKRFERDAQANPTDPKYGTRPFYMAGASAVGRYVGVHYVAYQGGSNLTRREALHYLAALDNGYVGTHYRLFRGNPPPPEPEAEIRFQCLVRCRWGWVLYGVTKRTTTRVYGVRLAGDGYASSYVNRSDVFKWNATDADLAAVQAIDEEYKRDQAAARDKRDRALASLKTTGDSHA